MAYINCGLCPAQSYPQMITATVALKLVRQYKCLSGHYTYVEEEQTNDNRTKFVE
jgi:hypothetical protein